MSAPAGAGRLLGVGAALVDGAVVPGDVRIAGGRVEEVGVASGSAPGPIAVPGLVDLQVNGFAGIDLRRTDLAGYRFAGEALAAHAATAVQPTYFGLSLDGYVRALDVLGEVAADQSAALDAGAPWGCRFLPAHLEGPFLNVAFKGAHDERTFLAPSIDAAARLLATGQVGFVTVAPEVPGGVELVRHLAASGVVVSIGHSDADVAATLAAVEAGARHLTHCWNAHRRLTSRDPGPAAVALARPDLVVGLIPDGVHVADETVRLTLHAAAGRVAATTDCIPPAGLASLDTWEEEPGMTVTVRDGRATLADGTLAGSIATPDAVLRNLVGLGLDLPDAVDACGGVQRRLLGLDDVRLRPGDVADVAVLDDALLPVRTLVAGHEVFAA
ncbi:N-acetylglucosamine-6-phosphate deacetylase [Dermatobacter hominis]|uniref:N-acetylglucosamine-6-phosphate deacetylase n=1 Tax=Dermatobacter hominis TaxID=2884263 RepID=UPI001D120DEA|nr:hypothetical protein [Dermatobacter hominis]UDY36911.1 hypothetical protein LH044_05100 [Dermatobacter hominis]